MGKLNFSNHDLSKLVFNPTLKGEKNNKDVVMEICTIMDRHFPKNYPHKNLIKYVSDRPGHDKRYSINSNKISTELGWKRKYSFEKGIEKTVKWYIDNANWWGGIY